MALLIMMVLTLEVFVVGSDDGGDDADRVGYGDDGGGVDSIMEVVMIILWMLMVLLSMLVVVSVTAMRVEVVVTVKMALVVGSALRGI